MLEIAQQLTLFIIAVLSNTLSALAGGGAGLLQLPALIFLGLPFPLALATHKIATVALGAGATLKHARSGHTEWHFSFLMLIAGLPGVILGARTVLDLPSAIAQNCLGALTIALGVFSYFKPQLGQKFAAKNRSLIGIVTGASVLFLLGILNGSLTSGTGLFVTLWLILWFGFDFKRATAYTMILVGIFWNGTGALTLAMLAPVQWSWIPALLLGSLIGGYAGAHLASKYGNAIVKRVFELITILVGIALIVKN